MNKWHSSYSQHEHPVRDLGENRDQERKIQWKGRRMMQRRTTAKEKLSKTDTNIEFIEKETDNRTVHFLHGQLIIICGEGVCFSNLSVSLRVLSCMTD